MNIIPLQADNKAGDSSSPMSLLHSSSISTFGVSSDSSAAGGTPAAEPSSPRADGGGGPDGDHSDRGQEHAEAIEGKKLGN